jgi:hypothetical protein
MNKDKRLSPWRKGMHFLQTNRSDYISCTRKKAADIADAAIEKMIYSGTKKQ